MADSRPILRQSRKDVVPSMYIVAKGLQNLGDPVYGLEICKAMAKITGELDAICVQKREGLWILTAKNKADRTKILLTGLEIRGHSIAVLSKSPRLLNGEQTIRLNISNIPYEVPDADLKDALDHLGIKFGQGIQYEFYKDEKNNFTGRRFVNMTKPPQPLPQMVKIADKYRAYLQYNRKEAHATPSPDPAVRSEKDGQHLNSDPQLDGYFEEDFERRCSNPTPNPCLGTSESSEDVDPLWPTTSSGWWKPPPGYVYGHASDTESENDCDKVQLPTPNGWIPGQRNGFPPRAQTVSDMILDYWKSRNHIRLNIQSSLEMVEDNNDTSEIQLCLDHAMNTCSGNGFWAAPDLAIHDQLPGLNKRDDILNKTNNRAEYEGEFEISSQTSLKVLFKKADSQPVIPASHTVTVTESKVQDSTDIEPSNPTFTEDLGGESMSGPDPVIVASPNTSYENYIITPPHGDEPNINISTCFDVVNDTSAQPLVEACVVNDTSAQPLAEASVVSTDKAEDKTVGLSDQTTLDGFLAGNNRKTRSITKEGNLESRKRSSSKRKIGSPEGTPEGKRPTKSKKSPKLIKKQGKSLGKDKVSRDGASGAGENTVDAHSSAFFGRWLNEQVRTSPT